MLDEVVDDLLFLAVGDPEDVPGLHVDDVRGVLPAVTVRPDAAVSVIVLVFLNPNKHDGMLRYALVCCSKNS